jgi:hypothetical protein
MSTATLLGRRFVALLSLAILSSALASAQVALTLTSTNGSWPTEVGWQVVNLDNNTTYHCLFPGQVGSALPNNVALNVPAGRYEVRAWDSFGDTWNGAWVNITYTATGVVLVNQATYSLRLGSRNTCPGPTAVTNTAQVIASFTVVPPCVAPRITANPVSQSICQGQPVTFSVSSNVSSGTYEWRRNGVVLATTTSNTYTIPSVTLADAGLYDVVIREACNPSVAFSTSASAQLTVVGPPVITTNLPSTFVVCENANSTLSIRASGAGRRFQWRKDGVDIPGATDSNLVINNATSTTAGVYDCVVSGQCAPSVTSAACALSVPTRPRLTSQPTNLDLCPGASGSISFTATGTNLVYQWYRDGVVVPNATSPTLSFTNYSYDSDGQYMCIVTSNVPNPNRCLVTAQTTTVRVSGFRPPEVTRQPQGSDACLGSNFTLVAEARGTGITYQWLRNGAPITGANSNELLLTNVTSASAGTYRCRVVGTCGLNVVSDSAVVNVITKPTFVSQPASQELTVGSRLELSVNATDARTYQWTKNSQPIQGATNATYVIEQVSKSDAAYYNVIVRNSCGGITSGNARVTVVDPVVPTPQITLGQTTIDFGEIPVGYDKTMTVSNCIQSTGTAPLVVSGIALSPGEFSLENAPSYPLTLAPGTSASISVTAMPTTRGTLNGTMIVSSNDAGAPLSTVSMTAAYVLRYDHAATQDFGTVLTDTSRDVCVTLTNTSAVDITIEQTTVTGVNSGSFTVQSTLPLAIAAGQTGEVCVRFAPGTPGQKTARLNLRSSTGGNSSIDLSGTGEVPGSVIDASVAGVSAVPNPMRESLTVRFDAGAPEMTVSVMDATGSVVSTFRHDAVEVGGSVRWDGRDASGAAVANGSYTMLIRYGATTVSMPIVVIR